MRLPAGIRRLFRLGIVRPQVSRDLDDELAFHFEETVRDLVSRGLTEAEATHEAQSRFGDERAYRRALQQIDRGTVRVRERAEFLNVVARTLGLSLRRIRRAPGFTASVVTILALGIGANAVMFGVVDRLLLSPPQHIVDPDEVHLLHRRELRADGEIRLRQNISYADYQTFSAVGAFTDVAAYRQAREQTVGRGEAVSRARVAGVSASLFPVLGVKPAFGRFFTAQEDILAPNPTAVLAHEYWERRYGSDPDVLGRTIDVGTRRLTIIGIAPTGFTGAELAPVDIWIPWSESVNVSSLRDLRFNAVRTVARVAPGATVETAEAEATARLPDGRDSTAEVVLAPIIAARGPEPTSEALVVRWLAGVSLVVLLIACFNVANLMLARSIWTRREIAVRVALGGSRIRLMGEQLTESVLLAAMGAGAALLVARVLGDTVHRILMPNVAFTDAALGGRLLGFTLLATLMTGLITGLIPALQAGKAELSDTLKAGGGAVAAGRSKTRSALLVGEVALSVVLLVGAGLFVRSIRTAQGLDLGFDSQNIVVVTLEFNEALERTERGAIYETALEGIRRLPGVLDAGLSSAVPFRSWGTSTFQVPGLDSIPKGQSGGPFRTNISSGYFEAMGLAILQGRGFEPTDDADEAPPVSVVSESMARAVWPAGDAIGGCMLFGSGDAAAGPCTEVVGIVENHPNTALVEDTPPFMYFLNLGHPSGVGPPATLMAGTSVEAEAIVDLIRDEVGAASTQIRFVNAVSMSDLVEPEMRSWKLGASVFTAFGFLALIVAGWGLYSVLAFDVALRQRELGIRSALGANVARLVRLVLGQAVLFVAAGVGIGLSASWAASRLVEPLLFQVSATDPAIYALVGVTLLLVAGIAGSLPAWRATRVDPREALQAD